MIDLHLHTIYSDGRFTPAEVIQAAAERGLSAVAITDHDNARGAREAAPLAAEAGIELVPGIEMTTAWPEAGLPPEDQNVDLLGYLFNLDDPGLRACEENLLTDLHERIAWTCDLLTRQGHPLSMDEVFAQNPHYGGAMQAIHALLRKDLAPDWGAGVDLFDSAWRQARLPALTIQEAIATIHSAGGLAVLAHPSIVRPGGEQLDERWLRYLVGAGLDGIEVYHHRLDEAARAHFLGLARAFDLVVTGGSDMHGWQTGFAQLDGRVVPETILSSLKARLNEPGSSRGRNPARL